jgi:hypothetical protein
MVNVSGAGYHFLDHDPRLVETELAAGFGAGNL